MTKPNKDSAAKQTVLEQIAAAVAAIPLSQCVIKGSPVEPGDEVIGHVNDYIKKFFTYLEQQRDTARTLLKRHDEFISALKDRFPGDGEGMHISASAIEALSKIDWKTSIAEAAEVEKLEDEIRLVKEREDAVAGLVWAEVRNSLGITKIYSIGLRDGWVVVKMTKEKENVGLKKGLRSLLSKLGAGAMFENA